MTELPTYDCHKRVQAFKIGTIDRDSDRAMEEDRETTGGAKLWSIEVPYMTAEVDVAYMRRCNPEVGGYYVRYEDGYESYSPAKAFEEGYAATSEMPTMAELLLIELLGHTGTHSGPENIKHHVPVWESTVGIGQDHTARVLIDPEALEVLNERTKGGLKFHG